MKKNSFIFLVFSLMCLTAISQVENQAAQELTPTFSQTVSPNSENPFFNVKNLSFFPNNELVVFNRWGNEVYNVSPYSGNWAGTKTGTKKDNPKVLLEEGTYFYIFTDKMSQNKYQGYFNLVH
jgi:gliding motility-associated-like protein